METEDMIDGDTEQEFTDGVRLAVLNLPEDEGEGLGFRLTRTLWDPYPWIREVTPDSRADAAGLKTGDCLLQADGKDLLGLTIGKVAGLIRGDGTGRGVSLLVWNCGVDPKDDPELLWSCGGGSRGERARRALSGAVRALACCVCASTAAAALHCRRSHLYCAGCWSRLERCALCRETLPAKDSPYAKNLVAEQVFEAIATEYEIKHTKRQIQTTSASTSPARSPSISPATSRRGQYQLSMMRRNRKQMLNNEKFASDPNLNRSLNDFRHCTNTQQIPTKTVEISKTGNSNENGGKCNCQMRKLDKYIQTQDESSNDVPRINVEDTSRVNNTLNCQQLLQHKLVARLRQACSLADLQMASVETSLLSKSLNNVNVNENSSPHNQHSNSMDNLKSTGYEVTLSQIKGIEPVRRTDKKLTGHSF